MRIFTLTPLGQRLAKSTSLTRNANGEIIYFLAKHQQSSDDRISENTGLSPVQVAVALRMLKAKRIVAEVGDSEAIIA